MQEKEIAEGNMSRKKRRKVKENWDEETENGGERGEKKANERKKGSKREREGGKEKERVKTEE